MEALPRGLNTSSGGSWAPTWLCPAAGRAAGRERCWPRTPSCAFIQGCGSVSSQPAPPSHPAAAARILLGAAVAEAFQFLRPKCFDSSQGGSSPEPRPGGLRLLPRPRRRAGLRGSGPSRSSLHGCSAPHAQTKQQPGREEVLALNTGLDSSIKQKLQNKAVVLRKVKPTPFLHKYHQGHGG